MKAQLLETPPKEEEGGGGGLSQVERDKIRTTGGAQNHLELRLGISLNAGFGGMGGGGGGDATKGGGGRPGGVALRFMTTPPTESLFCGGGLAAADRRRAGGSGAKRWFSQTGGGGGGFVDPWSLAARQEKAVFEQQVHQKANPQSTLSRAPPPVVGWPPVRTFRKKLVSPPPSKPDDLMEAEKDANKKSKAAIEEEGEEEVVMRSITMFVKVNMEGCGVGRKIDLMAHDSYDSLSHALHNMFHNFLSVSYAGNEEKDEQDKVVTPDYILLYEDNEGDRMLVGDVPWEMFISSVKRLYIAPARAK